MSSGIKQANKEQVFLATTALEEFWDTSRPVIFLGDWCLRYSRRHVWEPLKRDVLPSIWKDRERFIVAYVYLNDLYERLLRQMADWLDEVHGERHDVRYWRIIVGPWLFHYLDTLYDHYMSLKEVRSKYPPFDTILLSEDSFITPRSTIEFLQLLFDDPYNLQIYSRILLADVNTFKKKASDLLNTKSQSIRKRDLSGIIKNKLKKMGMRLVKKEGSICWATPYFSKRTMVKIILASKGIIRPIFSTDDVMSVTAPNRKIRDGFKIIPHKGDEFETLMANLLPDDIPFIFLESYKTVKAGALSYFPAKPRAIIAATSWYFDEKFKIWAAMAAESGCPLHGVQHGGNYGIDQYMRALDHEVAITDKFYSWGWNLNELSDRIIPMTMGNLAWKKNYRSNIRNTDILYAGTSHPKYSYRLQCPGSNHMEKYCADQSRFLKNLNLRYREKISYRPLIYDYGFDIVERIQNSWPDLTIENWDIPFQTRLLSCRLFVSDHLGNVHAEALSMDVPTVLFWDPESTIYREEAKNKLDYLRAVGILHDTPEAAAGKVNEVYDHVDEWWQVRERQEARSQFCEHYARSSSHAIDEWTNEFRKI
ncbi:MAG: LIC12162 family protein [Syntrophales bacterium]